MIMMIRLVDDEDLDWIWWTTSNINKQIKNYQYLIWGKDPWSWILFNDDFVGQIRCHNNFFLVKNENHHRIGDDDNWKHNKEK